MRSPTCGSNCKPRAAVCRNREAGLAGPAGPRVAAAGDIPGAGSSPTGMLRPRMKLRRLRLLDFRNIGSAALEFAGDRVFFLGANGQGKTNVLEAIGYLSALRAFRPGDNRVLIRENATEAALAFELEHEQLGSCDVVVRVRARGKEVSLDGTPVRRLAEHLGHFPSVFFASEDIQLVRGGPARRRRWLDLHLASLDGAYFAELQTYHRAIEARNRLLKTEGGTREIAAFEQQIAPAACALVARRTAGVQKLAAFARAAFAALTDQVDEATVSYRPDVNATDPAALLEIYAQQRPRDVRLEATQRGPHRDDVVLHVNGRDATLFASEGQQRALVLALRFAQLRDARTATGTAPVVLADDVLGELDPERRAHFWTALDPDLQLFATGTTPPAATEGRVPWQIVHVREGRFET